MARFDKLEFDDVQGHGEMPGEITDPNRADIDWMQQADQHRRYGLHENALKFYSRALESDRMVVGGWLGQVQMLVQLAEYPEAELWSRKALELFPGHGDLMAARGQALCRQGSMKLAHEMCDGALRQHGQSAYRWMFRGELMLAARQTTDRHCFDKAQQLEADWLVPTEIAMIYLFYRHPGRAHMRARRACEMASEHWYPWLVQARCQRALGLEHQCRRSLETCLELHPGHEEARQMLADQQSATISSMGRWLRGLFRR
jgi:tetratricopeptide (TPR) repeat protein